MSVHRMSSVLCSCGKTHVERTLLSAAVEVDLDLALALACGLTFALACGLVLVLVLACGPRPLQNKSKSTPNVKSGGQECPPHTSLGEEQQSYTDARRRCPPAGNRIVHKQS